MEGRKHRANKKEGGLGEMALMKLKGLKTSDTPLPILLLNMLGQLPGTNSGRGTGFSSVLGTGPGSVPGPTISCKTSGKCITSEI